MLAHPTTVPLTLKHPLNIGSKTFIANKAAYYAWMRENAPVYKGKMAVLSVYFLSRYDDCVNMLKDARFVRDRSTATGKGGKMPFPVPKTVGLLADNMLLADGSEHRRLRGLVHKAFTPRALARLEQRIQSLTHELLDKADPHSPINLMDTYAAPIPITVISELMGVSHDEMPRFSNGMKVLTDGFSGLSMFRTLFWDMGVLTKYVRALIAKKRANPQDDILTGLIHAEEDGERLTEDELVSMVFLLIMAGYETTVHLITNGVITLLQHPDQGERLKAHPDLMESAVEEILRYAGPVDSTKPNYAAEAVTLHGVTIPRGAIVMPLFGAANRDPSVFPNPDAFDIARTPNRHLGFGQGIHYCLGAPLARMETKIALTTLMERYPNLQLAVPSDELEIHNIPMWTRYKKLPVVLDGN